jgi:hypothetical protein
VWLAKVEGNSKAFHFRGPWNWLVIDAYIGTWKFSWSPTTGEIHCLGLRLIDFNLPLFWIGRKRRIGVNHIRVFIVHEYCSVGHWRKWQFYTRCSRANQPWRSYIGRSMEWLLEQKKRWTGDVENVWSTLCFEKLLFVTSFENENPSSCCKKNKILQIAPLPSIYFSWYFLKISFQKIHNFFTLHLKTQISFWQYIN